MTRARFLDADGSFPVIQSPDGSLYVTVETYAALQAAGDIDGGPGASDEAPMVGSMRDVTGWDIAV